MFLSYPELYLLADRLLVLLVVLLEALLAALVMARLMVHKGLTSVVSMVLPQMAVKDLLDPLVFLVLVVPQVLLDLLELLGLPVLRVLLVVEARLVLLVVEAQTAEELAICVPVRSFLTI